MTPFGKEIRKIRIDADITMSDMAAAIEKTPAYLSAVELGDKPLSDALVQDIIKYLRTLPYFREHRLDADFLLRLADRTRRTVDVQHLEDSEKEAVAGFARRLPGMSEQKRAALTRKVEEWMSEKEKT